MKMRQSSVLVGLLAILMLLAGACSAPADSETDKVAVRTEEMTLPWYTSEPIHKKRPRANGAIWPQNDTKKRDGKKAFQQVILENEYLRVEVLPEVGGAIGGAVYKPTQEDIFFREGKAKNWLPFWESGVKACFPWREHCIATTGQPVGHRTVRGEDGSVTLSMWMEFSRHDEPWQGAMFGRFTNLLLSQHVTLRPGESKFTVTYRITNPSPYRQGLRLWTDAFMPRTHTQTGAIQGDRKPADTTLTEWIFPAGHVSGHRAQNIRPYTEEDNLIRKHTAEHNSLFALDIRHGFAGLWYPQVGVNRLRVWDPSKAQAAKQYYRGEGRYRPDTFSTHMYNFCELWGGIDNVMEGVENWIGPGETYQFSHSYAMVRGIGKVDYANRQLAVNVELDGDDPVVEVVPFEPTDTLTVKLNGKQIGRLTDAGPTRPGRVKPTGPVQSAMLEISDGNGAILLKQVFPLEIPTDRSRHEEIKAASDLGSAAGSEKIGDQMDYGRTLETALRKYGGGSLGRGRILYRKGRLDAAIKTLRAFIQKEPADGEGRHLLGMAMLESGKPAEARKYLQQAVEAKEAYPPALYYLAVLDLAAGDETQAGKKLESLTRERPGHWEAKLLRTWLITRSNARQALEQAQTLAAEDPSDPRALRVLLEAAERAGDSERAKLAREALAEILKEPGAARRVEEFLAATQGRFVHPNRLKEFQ
ncbi:MAG: DUF5107 domain-containing protein [Phycisphaerae bacterium]